MRFETATPLKQAVLHLGMVTVGRWCRALVRRLLQRRLITGRCEMPIRLERRIELLDGKPSLRVVDRIVLTNAKVRARRMSFTTDLESAYVAASGVYQDAALQAWTSLDDQVEKLNKDRQITVVRQW